MYDNSNIKNYVVDIFGKKYIIKRYQKIIINGIYYIFLGIFEKEKDVPNVTCIYVINNILKSKIVKRSLISNRKRPIEVEETISGDDQPLRLNINVEDDELMVIMKSILIKRGITVGQFKKLYGDNKTDMNNDKSRLENKHTLSWNKFKFLLGLLKHDYDLIIYDND